MAHSAESDAHCLVCNAPATVDVRAPVSLDGFDAPAGRHAYEPMRVTLCQTHADKYHGPSVLPPAETAEREAALRELAPDAYTAEDF